jgi:hypothetical protein
MLQYLDMAIAFAAVMLGVSVLVTALTQVVNAIFAMRGRSLLWGLETLLTYVDPNFKEHARKIIEKILRHSLLSHTGGRRATAIRREEFIALLEDTLSEQSFAGASRAVETQRQSLSENNPAGLPFRFKAPEEYLKKLETWFDRVMNRVSERFALRSRWVSVSFAALLAFAFHLDSIALLEKFSTAVELRTSLVQSADVLLGHADQALALSSSAYTETIVRLKANNEAAQRLGTPPEFFTPAAARDWIRTQIGDSLQAAPLIRAYNKILDAVLREKIGHWVDVADSIRSDLDEARFQLIPKPYPGLKYQPREILGIVLSSILLSLGAPFWYNLLKTLSSLRPRVAQIIQREKEEAQEQPNPAPKVTFNLQ